MFKRFSRFLDSRIVALGGFGIAFGAWIFDAYIDTAFFETDLAFIDSLLNPEGHEVWMRGFVAFLLIVLGFIAAALLKTHETAEELHDYNQALLERFARDLEHKNLALEHEIERRKEMERRLAEMATTDPLTGIYNRRKFDESLQDDIKHESRYKRGLSLIVLDIDHFKRINDQFGHDVGDRVLKRLAALVQQHAREADRFFRIGGEEFALLSCTDDGEALVDAAERLREVVQEHDFGIGQQVTISLGASRFLPGDNCGSLFKRTDEALYEAKGRGRNRVVLL
ncbi:MAG: GGDEF domain-containing protein [Betaproteobacteria bacterium]|nr:GGDEF domain-containing protein [Betaproteobacteria bacterium]